MLLYLINVEQFFIVSREQFDSLLSTLELSLTSSDSTYMLTYLCVNVFAYLIIIFIVLLIMKVIKMLFSGKTAYELFHN